MHIIAFVFALVAVVLLVVDYVRTRAFLPLALAAFFVAWIIQLVATEGSRISM